MVQYIIAHNCVCTIAECADGYLDDNLRAIGLDSLLKEPMVKTIDLDFQDFDTVCVEGDEHYIPKCIKDFGIRIGIPATSKREGMIFSNNIKLFVGAVPRKMYQIGEPVN